MSEAAGQLECDLLVLGSGMAGLTAAGRAAERGERVIVIEKAAEIGGSAALSGGYLWTTPSVRQSALWDDGDPTLRAAVVETFPVLTEWLRRRGVHMEPHQPVLFGRGYRIDILGHIRQCASEVEKAGGHVVRETRVRELRAKDGRVVGAVADHTDGAVEIDAKRVLLATGGWQGSPDFRAEHIGPHARDIALRSNPDSVGDGLRLAIGAGAVYAGPNPGFYGHLLASPARLKKPADFVTFTQYHSDHAVLLNRAGLRFVDESRADHESTQMTLRQSGARALLIWDERIQREVALTPPVAGAALLDKFAVAVESGAKGAILPDIDALAGFATSLGFDGSACVNALKDYNARMRDAPETASPTRERHARPLDETPFRALLVEPAITFAYGGVAIDAQTRALDAWGSPIPGLFVAGADAGNVYRSGYCGGLALAGALGLRAGDQSC
ncbi:FAD-dependent oxidoreductase [Terrarubrum flagellatum]|uniref:FAD-dependent oxidoreductase n=1 Tax=Terrirubrum flagellatum TaxID=2895980 RepID=UPI0031455607